MSSNLSKETLLQYGCLTIVSMFTMVVVQFAASGDSTTPKQTPTMHQSTVQRLVV